MNVQFVIGPDGFLPTKGTLHSIGWDLRTPRRVTIQPGELTLIKLDIKSNLGVGLAAIMKEKSGLALKGIEIKAGVIDSDYRDEWGVLMKCTGQNSIIFEKGDKIAQFILVYNHIVELEQVESLEQSLRVGGFGSTGR